MKNALLLGLVLMALAPATTWAQTKLKLEHADQLSSKNVQSTSVDVVKGNVTFTHGKATIQCDSAYFNKKANTLEAFGNVHLQVDGDLLTGKRLTYDGNTHQAELQPVTGEVKRRKLK